MQTDAALLDEIDRIHDDAPERAAAMLRGFNPSELEVGRLGELAFLYNHMLGEKLGEWNEAAERIAALTARESPPPGVWRQLFAAHSLRGDALGAASARVGLARSTGARDLEAQWAGELTVLSFAPDPLTRAADVIALAKAAGAAEPNPLDAALAACFNNVTVRLLDAGRGQSLAADVAQALRVGAESARRFWVRAGEWLQHERADYLCAKVGVRIGDYDAAIDAAERGLAIVAASGDDPIERAFLLLPLAAALAGRGEHERARTLREEADALARDFETGAASAYAQDARELFGDAAA